jgi:polyisoprenoid-binding protein YceI
VVGATRQVSGDLQINPHDLSQSQVGMIQIGAGSLATDSGFRDRAIRDFILNTNQYPTITFTPTGITGLSGPAQLGQAITFQITGDLTIRNITQPVTFDLTVTGDSATQLSGTATAVVQRADYSLTIPSVPQVADVGEAVTLTIDFVAVAGQN